MPRRGADRRSRRRIGGAGVLAIVLTVTICGMPVLRTTGVPLGAPSAAHSMAEARSSAAPGSTTSPLAWVNLDAGVGSNRPSPRDGAAIAYDPSLNATILFGGFSNASLPYTSTIVFDDTWEYANGTWSQLNLVAPPAARFLSEFAWDPVDGYLLLYGGATVSHSGVVSAYSDSWAFVNQSWEKLNSTLAPPGLFVGAMSWDEADGYMVLYGGENTTSSGSSSTFLVSNSTWSFVHGQWTNRTRQVGANPGPMLDQMMAYDPAGGRIVMFGGSSATENLNTTWTYSADAWAEENGSTHPPALFDARMTTDPALDGAVLFGGVHEVANPYSESVVSTTWLYSDGNWSNLTSQLPQTPPATTGAALTYQADLGFLVLFGGDVSHGLSSETWSLGPPVLGEFHATPSPTDVGVLSVLNATPWGSVGTITYTYAGLPSGCGSANVSVLACRPNASGRFDVSITLADSDGYQVTHALAWQVNVAPQVASFTITPSALTLGARTTVSTTASGGTPEYSYSFANLPNGCASHGAANFSCAPSETGVYVVNLTLRDRAGGIAFANTTLVVNVAPSILTFTSDQPAIDLGEELNLTVALNGGTAPFEFLYAGLPPNCVSMNTPRLTCSPRGVGAYTVTVIVTDAFGNVANSATNILIEATPVVRNFTVGPAATDVGRPVGVSLEITGGTGPFQIAYLGLPPGCNGEAVTAFDCTPTAPGNYTIEAVVEDSTGWILRPTALLEVAPPLSVARFTGTPQPIDAGQSLTLTTTLSGGTAPFTYTYLGLPAGCGGASTASYTCQPGAGMYQVTVTAEDTVAARASQGLVFTVSSPAGLEVVSANLTRITVGGSVSIAVAATGGAPPYSYSYLGLPSGCPNVDTTNLTCTPAEAGTFTVTVTMTDGAGEHASQVVTLQVSPSSDWVTPLVLGVGVGAVVLAAAAVLLALRRRAGRGRRPPSGGAPTGPPDAASP